MRGFSGKTAGLTAAAKGSGHAAVCGWPGKRRSAWRGAVRKMIQPGPQRRFTRLAQNSGRRRHLVQQWAP